MALKTLKLSKTDTQHTQKNCQELQFEEKKKIFKKYLQGDSKKG